MRFLSRVTRRDISLAAAIVEGQRPLTSRALARLSNAANHSKLWVVLAGLFAMAGGRRGRRAGQRGVLSVALASMISNGLLKPLLPRPRPRARAGFLSRVRRPSSSSFPSGHAASAAAFATATAMEAPAIAAPVAALAAAVGYSRVSTGVHYPSDVVVGGAVGAAVAAATVKWWPLIDPSPADARPVRSRLDTTPTPDGAGLVVVVNASAGPRTRRAEVRVIEQALPAARIVEVENPEHLDRALVDAAETAAALGVLGGDGTVSAAAAAALAADVPLVVFPGGTLNHFARDIGVDTVEDALAAVRAGQLVELDVGVIDGRVFLNTASFGGYTQFVDARERFEKRIGKWPAVALALGRVLTSGTPLTVSIDGRTRTIWLIFVGNCAYDPPGFAPATRARLDDGLLDVRLIDGTDPRARLRLILAVLTGQLGRSAVYTRELVDRLEVDTGSSGITLAADGETFPGNGTFVVEKASRRLRTFAPHR